MAQQINLFNPQFRTLPKLFGAKLLGLACGLILLGSLVLWAVGRYQNVRLQNSVQALQLSQAKLSAMTNQLLSSNSMQLATALSNNLAQVSDTTESRERLLDTMSKAASTKPYSDYFDGFSLVHIDGVWLAGFAVRGDLLSVDGRALAAYQLPRYIAALNAQPAFAGQRFTGLQIGSSATPGGTSSEGIQFLLKNADKSAPGAEGKS